MSATSEEGRHSETACFEREIRHGRYLAQSETETIWGWATPAGQRRFRRRAELIVDAAALSKDQKVLEIGCGTGLFTEKFAATGCHLTAVDLAPELITRAQARLQHRENVRFELTPFEECRELGPFDAVIGSSVLHHLNLPKALDRMIDLLRPGGRLAFAEPNLMNPQVFLERKFRRFFPYVSPDETAFSRCRMGRDLDMAGFSDIRIVPFDWIHPATPAKAIPLIAALGRFFERLPGIREFSGSLLISARKGHMSPS